LNTNKSAENKGKVLFININVEFVMTGGPEREQVWDYPLEALREALINAVCHRKWEKGYFKSVAIRHVGQSAVNSKYLLRLQIPAPLSLNNAASPRFSALLIKSWSLSAGGRGSWRGLRED
jgi:hypothetical protein